MKQYQFYITNVNPGVVLIGYREEFNKLVKMKRKKWGGGHKII